MARENLAERFEHVPPNGHTDADRQLACKPLGDRLDRRNLRRDDPARLLVSFELPADEHERARLDQRAAALERFRKDDDLDAALGVLQREDRHPVAFPRLQRSHGGDDTTDARVRLNRLSPLRSPRFPACW